MAGLLRLGYCQVIIIDEDTSHINEGPQLTEARGSLHIFQRLFWRKQTSNYRKLDPHHRGIKVWQIGL